MVNAGSLADGASGTSDWLVSVIGSGSPAAGGGGGAASSSSDCACGRGRLATRVAAAPAAALFEFVFELIERLIKTSAPATIMTASARTDRPTAVIGLMPVEEDAPPEVA